MGARCTGITEAGEPCSITSNLVNNLCLWHDPARRDEATAARVAGGRKSSRQKVGAKLGKIRVALPEHIPPLESLHDAVAASAWLFAQAAAGQLDGVTVRECNRSISSFVNAVHKADLLKRIRELEKQLKLLQS